MPQDLDLLEPWLESHLASLSPARRTALARKVGQVLRRANAKRIAANIQPDGTRMQPRKSRTRLKDRERKTSRGGRMFPKMRLARSITIKASPDGVLVGYNSPMLAHTARAHQYGLEDHVGRTADGKEVRAKYPVRVLLGFGPEDREMILEAIMQLLED
jgi:phage virion morphogenesis protein